MITTPEPARQFPRRANFAAVDPWIMPTDADPRGAGAYGTLVASLRELQDHLIAAADMPSSVMDALRAQVTEMARTLAPYAVPEDHRWAGRRPDLPGRGNLLLPPFVIDQQDAAGMTGRVTFTEFYVGGNAAAHGGTLPLMFDDLMGFAAAYNNPNWARTAYLKVNFRNVTPIGVELRFEVTVERIEGRKRFVTGRLLDGDVVCCDADALFVTLRPGQP